MAIKTKLDLANLADQEVVDLAALVGTSMGKNAATFPSPNPALATLASLGATMSGFMKDRADLLQQAQTLTIKIRDARNAVEGALNSEAGYAEDVVKDMPDDKAAAAI